MAERRWAEVVVGAVIVAGAVGFLGYALAAGGRGTSLGMGGGGGLTLTAQFDRIDGLGEGAAVRIAGVRVGSVAALRVDPRSFAAEVTLRLDRDLRLPADTSAEVASESLLGGKYVSLMPGGAERVLGDGGRITETQGAVSLESLLGRFIFSVTQLNTRQPGEGDGASR